MLRLADNSIVLSATDFTNFLACSHLTQQRLAIARGERGLARPAEDPYAELIEAKSQAQERAQLERLSAQCGGYVDLSALGVPDQEEGLEEAAAATAAAMREGASLIYQAALFDGRWQGRADFLRRVGDSEAGQPLYEVVDAKLARQVKPTAIHQLCLYSRLLGSVQGGDPERAHLILGDGSETAIDLRRYAALHRHVTRQLEAVVARPAAPTYPEPIPHCEVCALAAECRDRWVTDDHLSLIASIRRDHREQLVEDGITTLAGLAETSIDPASSSLGSERFSTLQRQAELQVSSRTSGRPLHRHLQPVKAAGYGLLPGANPADVFFDLEGDPFVGDDGIEYLWGWWTAGSGYECEWAHSPAAEKVAFERFIDRVIELRRESPGMHVFHYAPHERSKLRSLSIQYATREDEVDTLLRAETFVDLYAVVRQGMQVGEESYSLKKLERHQGFERKERRIREGGGSIIAYEAWLETGDSELLESIRAYNEEDCRSTHSLRDWLLGGMQVEAEAEFDVDFDDYREPEKKEHPPPPWMEDVRTLIERLLESDGGEVSPLRRLMANLVLYHYRESKPSWWRYFDLRGKPLEELIEDPDALAGLTPDEQRPPEPVKQSLDYVFEFPPQDFRLKPGDAEDPATGETFKVVQLDDERLVLRRSNKKPPPQPKALIAKPPVNIKVLREAVMELAESVLAGEDRFRASLDLLGREPPRLASGQLDEELDSLIGASLGLDRSVLPVQGPPGTGKTYRGAGMIVAALAVGKRVGIVAPSHASIQNLLHKVELCADKKGVSFAGFYKGKDYEGPSGLIECADDNAGVTAEHQLVAGTAWLFSRPEHRQAFDLIFVDEAGQFALADGAAVGLASSNLVLLGDPQQLSQVSQADHPEGSGASALEHVLDGAATIPPDRGVLLTETWRMHPDVCGFVSERSYDSRLHARPACAKRKIDAAAGSIRGTGLRSLAVTHEGRSQSSPEEAEAISSACEQMLGGAAVTDDEGLTRELKPADILVVAPYNLAVRQIANQVPAGVRVGTVDKFQGQQAPIVFFAMTCSSGEEIPRGMEFLFDHHRVNVAVSRAECLAVLVHSPRLLDVNCRTPEAMELADGICRFVELAEPV